jgi:hypothetical protein
LNTLATRQPLAIQTPISYNHPSIAS